MSKKNVTPEELISKGYKEFKDYAVSDMYVKSKRLFQKKIINDESIRYFINFIRYEYDVSIGIRITWSVEFQFTPKGYDTIQIELVQWFNEGPGFCNEKGHTVEEVEELCEKIFNRMEGVNYE